MDVFIWFIFFTTIANICEGVWRSSSEEDRKPVREERPKVHYHTKRHMMPADADPKKYPRSTGPLRSREIRKKVKAKPSGHLTPLKEDDIDNDEVVSVAIGPPPMRPMYDKLNWKPRSKNVSTNNAASHETTSSSTANFSQGAAVALVKDVLAEIGREFLTHQVNENFVFGQYVGQAMKNISSEQKLKFQHDILELVIKYQKLSKGENHPPSPKSEEKKDTLTLFKDLKEATKIIKPASGNETEESWPDFSNLAKIVG